MNKYILKNLQICTDDKLYKKSLTSTRNEHYIFVEQEPNFYKQEQVRIWISDQGFTEIIPLEKLNLNKTLLLQGRIIY